MRVSATIFAWMLAVGMAAAFGCVTGEGETTVPPVSGGTDGAGAGSGTGGTGAGPGTGGTGGVTGNNAPVINYVAWEYPAAECPGIGDATLTVEISAYDVDEPETTENLTYSGTVFDCDDISISGEASPVTQDLNCFTGSLTMLSVTVEDEQGNTNTIEDVQWESAICEEGCVENDDDFDIREFCQDRD